MDNFVYLQKEVIILEQISISPPQENWKYSLHNSQQNKVKLKFVQKLELRQMFQSQIILWILKFLRQKEFIWDFHF